MLNNRWKIGRVCWIRCQPDCVSRNGYYHSCLIEGEFWSASILWHRCIVMDSPEDIIWEIQGKRSISSDCMGSISSRLHWVRVSKEFAKEDMDWWMSRVVSMLSDYKQPFTKIIHHGLIQRVSSFREDRWAWTWQTPVSNVSNETGRHEFVWNYWNFIRQCFKYGGMF